MRRGGEVGGKVGEGIVKGRDRNICQGISIMMSVACILYYVTLLTKELDTGCALFEISVSKARQ